MAKLQGIFGAGRGKVGNVVLSKGPKANTIARAYQPQVTNPKSALQIEQRSKMNAAGQFSRLWPKSDLSALGGGSALSNRSLFNRSLLRTAKYSLVGQKSSIIPDLVEFSRGVTAQPQGVTTSISESYPWQPTDSGIEARFHISQPNTRGVIARVHAAFLPYSDIPLKPIARTVNIAIDESAISGVVAGAIALTDSALADYLLEYATDAQDIGSIYLWVEYLVPSTEAARQAYQSIISSTTNGDNVISAVVDNITANGGSWTKTNYVGAQNVNTAPQIEP